MWWQAEPLEWVGRLVLGSLSYLTGENFPSSSFAGMSGAGSGEQGDIFLAIISERADVAVF